MKAPRPTCEGLESRTLLSRGPIPGPSPVSPVPWVRGVTPATAAPPVFRTNPVLAWNEVALDAVRAEAPPPPVAAHHLAVVQGAVHDAVRAVSGGGPRAYLTRSAAAAGAAHEALRALFPGQAELFEAELEETVAALGRRLPTLRGLALGRAAADRALAARSDDGSGATATYLVGADPGDWRPTPPAFAAPLLPQWPGVRTFALPAADMFLPPGPPDLSSVEYAAAVAEVRELGGATSAARTADQTEVAVFWADGPGTATPPGHWNEIAAGVSASRGDSLLRSARVLAVLNQALADAAIAAWDCKYVFDFWRPVTAVRGADADGNPATAADPDWAPLLSTPPFPSYVSGHSTFSGAAAAVLSAFYGPNTRFVAASDALPGVTRTFTSFAAASAEAGMSRIYGGIHFAFDNDDGLALGRAIGEYALRVNRPRWGA